MESCRALALCAVAAALLLGARGQGPTPPRRARDLGPPGGGGASREKELIEALQEVLEKLKSKRVPHYEKKFGQVPMLRGLNSAHPGGSSTQPPAVSTRTAGFQPRSPCAGESPAGDTGGIQGSGTSLAGVGLAGEIGCFTGATTERKLSGSVANYQGIS
ncbi:cocaine- and amphetamine-regulated transcript protein isoform X1 [Falco naumanni]|uniref:cocaine- and amphetamine-regulated transcript protein isoform X1 n=1 Tax=Falco naumanni TaxID=148594 RepID=UPI001ADE674D|nr:cocaine- and amphetamine-regulated transcript protein isoform X1 [Falco naumanni]